ncbi:MAG: MATE family efflux transporter, partial [Erysipelotrichaceae bacterium]|nr:MATE family efflux transporter [Erysipelotrichaceae bacterium]
MNKMETMEVKKLVLSMSFPIMISMLVQALYNIVDSMFVAQYSQDSLLAISLCYPIQTILVAVAVGICVGFNTVLSRYLGQKEID